MATVDGRPKVSAWSKHSAALAAWHLKHLVNRTDAHGRYIKAELRGDGESARTDKSALTLEVLQLHFMGRSTGDLIGLHSTVRDDAGSCWSRWGAVDVDLHDGKGDPEANLRFVLALYAAALALGFRPLLYDSNGRGGYHLVLLFEGPVPTEKVFAFLRWLIRDWKAAGLDEAPETFPKQASIKAGGFGNWLRLPGRHHTHDHWTRVWDGGRWLEGNAAVRYILETTGTPGDVIPAEALVPPTREKKGAKVDPDSAWDIPVQGTALNRYVQRALADEVANLINAPVRGRNDQLNKSAFALGQLIGPELSRADVERSLRVAARGIGLGDDEIEKTFASGIDAGMLEPRDLSHVGQAAGQKHRNGATNGAVPSANGNGHGTVRTVIEADDDGPEDDEKEVLDRWPRVHREAFYGLAGDIVRAVDPHTEADLVAVLVQFLAAFTNLVGRRAHFAVGATRHYLNLFVALTGSTATGRKGSAWDVVKWILEPFDAKWANTRILGGLISGEGLIHHVRDRVEEEKEFESAGQTVTKKVCVDPGVEDKRLLVLESEMARVLKAMNRESNTLSGVIRQAWDGGTLGVMGKHKGEIATGAHISIVGHITKADVVKFLASEDSCNGFANRFLWVAARRSKLLPDGGDLLSEEFAHQWEPLKHRLERAVAFARECGRMKRDRDAGRIWREVYGELSAGKPGLLGAVLGRAEAQVMRLACVFALLDESPLVRPQHLGPAMVLWKYCEDSTRYVFGDSLSSPAGEKLLEALKAAPGGLARNQIFDGVFGRHKSRLEISNLLSELLTEGLIHRQKVQPEKGRPAEVWFPGRGEVESAAP